MEPLAATDSVLYWIC